MALKILSERQRRLSSFSFCFTTAYYIKEKKKNGWEGLSALVDGLKRLTHATLLFFEVSSAVYRAGSGKYSL